MQKLLRNNSRLRRFPVIEADEDEDITSPSYFEWRERTGRFETPARAVRATQPSPLMRLIRRIAGR
jgi:hypothetical protein